MSDRWHVIAGGKSHGPFTLAQLRALAAARKIAPGTQLQRESDRSSITAAALRGLFSTDPPLPPPASQAATQDSPARSSHPRTPVTPPVLPGSESAGNTGSDRPAVPVDPGVLRGVLYAALGMGALSILMEPWMGVDDNGSLKHPFAPVGFLLSALAAVVLETIVLFSCWQALPRPHRFHTITPWLGAGLSFVPLFGLGWYFVAYGLLGQAWRREAAERTPGHDATLSWAGWACAGGMLLMWLMWHLTAIAYLIAMQNGGDSFMSWYDVPLLEGTAVPRTPSGGRRGVSAARLVLRYFSLHAVAHAAMLYILYRFYTAIIDRIASNRASHA